MLDKNLLGYLSIKGEVGDSADPATVSQNDGDSGGWSYGLYQLASKKGSVQAFLDWLQQQPEPWANYGRVLAASGDPTCDESFVEQWKSIGTIDPVYFGLLQTAYTKGIYYDAAAQFLIDNYDFNIENRSFALKQVLFSNAVQHGPEIGAQAFYEGAEHYGADLNDMPDHEIIWHLYEVKIEDPAWTSGAPEYRGSVESGLGLYGRWDRERAEAIEMLGG